MKLHDKSMTMSFWEHSKTTGAFDSPSDPSVWFDLVSSEANLSKVKNFLKQGYRIDIKNDFGNSALHIAAFKGLERLVELLINRGADFNSKNKCGDTPISLAAMNGHYRCVKLLIQRHAKINDTNHDEVSPLMLAAQNGHKRVIRLLLANKSQVNFCGKHGSALHFATMGRQVEAVKLLLKNKSDVNVTTDRKWTALNIAADVGSVEISIVLLASPGVDINRANEFAVSPMLTAAFRGSKSILEILIQHSALPQSVDIYGHTALMLACLSKSLKTVEYLTPFSDLSLTNTRGENALMIAAKNGSRDIVHFLLKQPSDIDAVNNEGDNALMLATSRGYADVAHVLLKYNAVANCANKAGMSPLMLSCKVKSNCTKMLLDKNVSVNTACAAGRTALLIASEYGNEEAVKMLIKRGSDIDHVDLLGESALMKAAKNGRKDIVQILIMNKASVSVASYQGWTALMFALKHHSPEIVHTLLKQSADASSFSNDGFSVLMVASKYSNSETIETLLHHKAYVHYCNSEGWMALHVACQSGKHDNVDILMQFNANVDHTTVKGWTPLMLAASEGHVNVVELLLEKDASVNQRNDTGCTALHVASEARSQPNLLKLLFEFGAEIELKNKDGYTSLFIAARKDYFQNVQKLLEFGARYDHQDENKSAIMIAIRLGHYKSSYLILKFAELYLTNTVWERLIICAAMHGRKQILEMMFTFPACNTTFLPCALHNAVIYGRAEIVRYLLYNFTLSFQRINEALMTACINNQADVARVLCQRGAKVDYQDAYGYTPLIKASRSGSVEALKLLLQYNCDVNFVARVVSYNGTGSITPAEAREPLLALHVAVRCGHYKCVEELLKAGAEANAQDIDGLSPLTFARMHNNKKIENLLLQYNAKEINRTCVSIRDKRINPRVEINCDIDINVENVENLQIA